jgi:TonB-linked SusC/RagA family outer membrane protein
MILNIFFKAFALKRRNKKCTTSFINTLVGKQAQRIMKLTAIIMLSTFLSVSARGYSQQITLSGKNAPMEEILKQIQNQSAYRFIYTVDVIQKAIPVNISVKNVPLAQALSLCFKDQPLTYSIVENVIVIKAKEVEKKAGETLSLPLPPPPIIITGRVTNAKGEPLPMVSIVIKGTKKGFITDFDGYYKLQVDADVKILIFSHIGMKKQEVVIANRKTINVVMVDEMATLEEVQIISTGYQKIKPEQSTGSITTIQAKDYNSRINTTDFLTGLQGKIPGLLIDNDIKFQGNSLFQIRGISTINGNKNPLIVVDGFPTELTLDMINPNEIESVTVLKDAAAATIYGARSSNGVIVIERKKAKSGKINVDFQATTSFRPKENYDRYRWDKDGANTDIGYDKILYANSVSASTWSNITGMSNGSSYYNYPTPYFIMAQQAASVITADQANQQYTAMGAYNNAKDYARLFLRTASTQTYNLDVSGGTDNALYYITANYTNNDAEQIKNDNNLFHLSGRSTLKFSKRFSLDLTTEFQESKAESVPIPDINNIYPYEHFQDTNGNPLPVQNGSYATPYYNAGMMALGLLDNMYYPLVDINEVSNKTLIINNRTTANFLYNIGNGFKFNFGGVYETSSTDTRHLASVNSSEAHQYINRYTKLTNGVFTYNIPQGGDQQLSSTSLQSYTLRAQLNYDKQISKDHSLNIIFGGEVRDVVNQSNNEAYFGYNDQTLLSQPVDYKVINSFYSNYASKNPQLLYTNLFPLTYSENRYVSAYSNLVYAYKGKYSLTGSFRIDQSNLFGTDPKYRYKPLWSVGAAWNIHKEDFMHDISWIKSLKLRVAEGFNGNVAKNALPQVIVADAFNYTSSTTIAMLALKSLANSGLRWEQTHNYNIGLDYDIFKNISGSIDYYIKESTDILANNPIDATAGAAYAVINNASIRNNGLEVRLNADWITRKDFNWNTGIVLSHNTSKVLQVYNTSITSASSPASSYVHSGVSDFLEGYAVGAMFNYRYAGIDPTGQFLVYDKNGAKIPFASATDKSCLVYSGSAIPTYNVGLSNRIDIGNFYVYCMINYYGGFKVRVPVPDPSAIRPLEGAGNYWKQAGDENNPNVLPSPLYPDSFNIAYTDKYTVNGDYFTLGDLTASYSFRDSKLVKKTRISNFEVKLQASNLYTVALNKYNYSMATGSYAKSYLTPTYTIGINVNF